MLVGPPAASRDDLVRGQRKYRFIKLIKLGDTTIPVIIHKPDRVHVFNFRIRSCGDEEDGDIGRRNRFAQALECGSQFVYEHVRIQPAQPAAMVSIRKDMGSEFSLRLEPAGSVLFLKMLSLWSFF